MAKPADLFIRYSSAIVGIVLIIGGVVAALTAAAPFDYVGLLFIVAGAGLLPIYDPEASDRPGWP